MICPQCGANTKPNSRFCPMCGHQFSDQSEPQGHHGNQASSANTPPTPPVTSAKKTRSKLPLAIACVVLLGGVLVFAGFGIGLVPRFWESKDKIENSGVNGHTDEENGIALPNLEECTESEAFKRIEDAGLKKGKTIEHYTFAADSSSADNVIYAMVDGQMCPYSQKLKEGTEVDVVVFRRPDLYKTKQYVDEKLQIDNWMVDDPSYFEGKWVYDQDLRDHRNSNCDASSDEGRTPVLTIDKANPNVQSTDVHLQTLLHLHSNDTNSRHYGASDDKYEDVGQYFNYPGDTLVCSFGDFESVRSFYWREKKELVDTSSKDEAKIQYEFGVGFAISSDTPTDEDGLKKLMGDDIAKEYETEEEAMDAVVKAYRDKAHLVLCVTQRYGDSRVEVFQMKKADGDGTTNS